VSFLSFCSEPNNSRSEEWVITSSLQSENKQWTGRGAEWLNLKTCLQWTLPSTRTHLLKVLQSSKTVLPSGSQINTGVCGNHTKAKKKKKPGHECLGCKVLVLQERHHPAWRPSTLVPPLGNAAILASFLPGPPQLETWMRWMNRETRPAVM
jgi:hypothetical protein